MPGEAPRPDAASGTTASGRRAMWGGRFGTPPSAAMTALNDSLAFDWRLFRHDIQASRAWARALARARVIDEDEAGALVEGLQRVERRIEDGAAEGARDEDIHSLVERLLYEEVGEVAGKLHTGRSRNDQVATDLRLWCLDALAAIDRELTALGRVLLARAREGIDIVLPGYTHGQQAQPVRWGFVLAAHAWPLVRDRSRLADLRPRTAQLPLGSGALAGSGVAVDRDQLRTELGFEAITPNALDATGDRDFVAETIFVLALIGTHLSRLGSELVSYSSTEYGFIRLADDFSTGSSLLPQKRNPDVFELARAKAARTLGDLVAMLGTLHALPAGYSKDLQEDKPHLFDAVDTVLTTLPAVRGAVETMIVVEDRMRDALQQTLLSVDVADELVGLEIPFREAHVLTGRLVREAERLGCALTEVPYDVAESVHADLPRILGALGSYAESTERRLTEGGTARASLLRQLDALETAFVS